MDPIIISLIATVSLGAVLGMAALIRQLLLSRDKKANDDAHRQSLDQEVKIFAQIRNEIMESGHLKVYIKSLVEIKEIIKASQTQLTSYEDKKKTLLESYRGFMEGLESADLPESIQRELRACDQEIEQLNVHINGLRKIQRTTVEAFLEQAKLHSEGMKELNQEHTTILFSIILRHIESMEGFGAKSLQAGAISFKDFILSPFQQLFRLLGRGGAPGTPPRPNPNPADSATQYEIQARQRLDVLQRNLNETIGQSARYRFMGTAAPSYQEEPPVRLSGSATV